MVSVCKKCRRGVFKDQPKEWGRGQHLGWCHIECPEVLSW
jgi:hypothetical protein